MKKFIYILSIVILAWLAKLSYDFYLLSKQMSEQQQTLLHSQQRNDNLNDQVVALQRTSPSEDTAASSALKNKEKDNHSSQMGLNPIMLIQQQLELIQFALAQQQFVYALEKMNALKQNIQGYEIAESLKQSLLQTLSQDQQNIQQYVATQHTQQQRFSQLLQQLDQRIQQELNHPQLSPAKIQPDYFWQRWLQVERVSQPDVHLNHRVLILKEVQLRILIAQQALLRGEYQSCQNMLNAIIEQFDMLPDAESQRIKQQLIHIKQKPVVPIPKLKTREILG